MAVEPLDQSHWGRLAVIDLSQCMASRLANPSVISRFLRRLVPAIEMKAHGAPQIERFGTGNLEGWSAMQFIETSTITLHTDEPGLRCFIDIFSCKPFDADHATMMAKEYFGGSALVRVIDR